MAHSKRLESLPKRQSRRHKSRRSRVQQPRINRRGYRKQDSGYRWAPRAYTSLQDWIQDNDTDGTLAAKRDTAREQLDLLLEERGSLIKEVVRTYNVLRNASTNSFGAADPTYDALTAAHQDDRFANDALIRGTLKSHRAELDNMEETRKAATTPPARAATTPTQLTNPFATAGHSVAQSVLSPQGFTTPPTTPRDNIFSGVKITSAYLYLLEHNALKWPSNDDRASLMEHISVSALRAGMVLPVLQLGGPEAFATLVEPDAYYVVTAEHPDNSMRLSLAYRNPACARALPPCLTFDARSTQYSVAVIADTAIWGNIWEQHVLAALRALNVPLTAHTTHPPALPPINTERVMPRCAQTKQPLRRAGTTDWFWDNVPNTETVIGNYFCP